MRLTLDSSLLCDSVVFGNSSGLAVVDYLQKTLLLNMGTTELYSPSDPYPRQPRSPRKARQPSAGELRRRPRSVTCHTSVCTGWLVSDVHVSSVDLILM